MDDPYFVPELHPNGTRIRRYRDRKHPLKMWTETEFRKRYRLPKYIALDLIRDYEAWVDDDMELQGGSIPHEDRFCLALRYMATGANYAPLAETQGVGKSMVTRCLYDVLEYFGSEYQRYIKWPENEYERLMLANEWEEDIERPRCIGAVDGTHLAIKKPYTDPNEPSFVNRKGFHSINAMVVCDSKKRIRHIDPRFPGNAGDAYVFGKSQIYRDGQLRRLGDFYLLGDSGYGLLKNLYTPNDRPLTAADRAYNTWHRKSRSVVERTIGLWKQRWRCLDNSAGYLYHDPPVCARIAIATACLHNICIDNDIPVYEDNDRDGYRAIQQPLPQPEQFVGPQEHLDARADFITTFF